MGLPCRAPLSRDSRGCLATEDSKDVFDRMDRFENRTADSVEQTSCRIVAN